MRVIAITNQKGGSGKTTTSVNIAACLAEMGRKVLLIDLDIQSSASQWLNISGEELVPKLEKAYLGKASLWDLARPTDIENLSMIPSDHAMIKLVRPLAAKEDSEFNIAHQLKDLKNKYDYLIMDCSPDMGPFTMQALLAAKEVIVPIEAHFLAVHGLANLLKTMDLAKKEKNPKLRLRGVLACRVDHRVRHCDDVVSLLRDQLNELVYKTVIRENIKLAECPSFHTPITRYAPNSHGAEDYRNVTAEILQQDKSGKS